MREERASGQLNKRGAGAGAEGREDLLTVKPTLPIRTTLRYDCHGSSLLFLSLFLLFFIWGLFVWPDYMLVFIGFLSCSRMCCHWFTLILAQKWSLYVLASFYAFVIIFLFSSFKSSLDFSPPALLSTRIIHEMVLGLKGFFCFVFLLTIHFVLLFVYGKWVWETASGDGC